MVKKVTEKLVLGDAYEEIKRIDDQSIDLILIDPPYDIAKSSRGSQGKITKALQSVTADLEASDVTGGIDLSILDEFMRVMKRPNIYIWCNKKQILDYMNFFIGKHNCSFDILVWIKSNPVPTCGRNYMNDKEFCLYFRKGVALKTTYQTGKTYWITPTNVKDKRKYNHPTIKPLEIIKTLIGNSSDPGDVVLDCFLGSGTTAVAAAELHRGYYGIEKSTKHFETCCRRIAEIN